MFSPLAISHLITKCNEKNSRVFSLKWFCSWDNWKIKKKYKTSSGVVMSVEKKEKSNDAAKYKKKSFISFQKPHENCKHSMTLLLIQQI